MNHRHINPSSLSLAAIDDVICRGGWQDWIDLRGCVLASSDVLGRVQRVCRPHLANGYAQRYHFWMNYAQAHAPAGGDTVKAACASTATLIFDQQGSSPAV
jgi:hypothetical protein